MHFCQESKSFANLPLLFLDHCAKVLTSTILNVESMFQWWQNFDTNKVHVPHLRLIGPVRQRGSGIRVLVRFSGDLCMCWCLSSGCYYHPSNWATVLPGLQWEPLVWSLCYTRITWRALKQQWCLGLHSQWFWFHWAGVGPEWLFLGSSQMDLHCISHRKWDALPHTVPSSWSSCVHHLFPLETLSLSLTPPRPDPRSSPPTIPAPSCCSCIFLPLERFITFIYHV